MIRLASLAYVVGLLVSGGCRKDPLWCPDEPGNTCTIPDAPPTGCASNGECSTPTPVCDVTGSMSCVQCLPSAAAACVAATPVCGDDHACRACEAHDECASGACLPDGSCAAETNVAYVGPAGSDNPSCSRAQPCTKLTRGLATSRLYVKLSGTTDDGATVAIDNQDVTLLADAGAKLVRTSNGIVLEVRGTSNVTIYDLEISGGSGAQGIGISLPTGNTATLSLVRAAIKQNAGGGIVASAGTLRSSRSSVLLNAGGGISLSSANFDLTNNVIASNGGSGSTFGGLKIDNITGSGTRRLDFNTIAANQAPATVNTGISCGTVLAPLTFSNNIIYGNLVASGGKQLGGSIMCSATYSDIGPDASPGMGNINIDPMFANAAQQDFHLKAGSPAKDAADPASTLPHDIDGDPRPQGPGRDVGADELR